MASALLSGGGRTARQPVVALRLRREERSPEMCIVAAFVSLSCLRRESETESESADFFMNPSETVRLRDFENSNNTMKNILTQLNLLTRFLILTLTINSLASLQSLSSHDCGNARGRKCLDHDWTGSVSCY